MIKKNILIKFFHELAPEYRFSQAKNFIPEWYKKQKALPENQYRSIKKLPILRSFKSCSPFGETFMLGYVVPLEYDIAVEQTDLGPVITWNSDSYEFVRVRVKEHNPELPTPEGYSSEHFVWITHHMVKIPKGYSALFTHPLNRYDLPFLTLSGVVDGDYVMPPGQVPVFFNKTFEGIIPAGTPIMQVIFFKNETYKIEEDPSIERQSRINDFQSGGSALGWYKRNIWKKKEYN